jgi:hypothetical protein
MIQKEDIIPNFQTVSQKLSEMVELLKRVAELDKKPEKLGFPLHLGIVKKD